MTAPTISFAADWQNLVASVPGGRQLVQCCPKCGGWRFGDGPHAPHDVSQPDGTFKRVDCVGEVVT